MWSTAGILHAAGLAVDKSGEIKPAASVREPVFVMEPIRVQCSSAGVTNWSKDPASTRRFLMRVTDPARYPAAMTAALRSRLHNLP